MPINVFEYLNQLDQLRFRAVIFHAAPEKNSILTRFAQSLCTQANGEYLDLLGTFIESNELRAKVDSFNPQQLRALLIEKSNEKKLLCVDRVDFLMDTWRRTERADFYRMINNQWDGYRDETQSKLIVTLQTSAELEQQKIVDTSGQSRIFRLSDFNDIL
jgi:hypothetical protein